MKSLRAGALGIALLAILGATGAHADGIAGRSRIQDGSYAAPTFVWNGLYVEAQSDTLLECSEFSLDGENFFDINLSGCAVVCYASATISSLVRPGCSVCLPTMRSATSMAASLLLLALRGD